MTQHPKASNSSSELCYRKLLSVLRLAGTVGTHWFILTTQKSQSVWEDWTKKKKEGKWEIGPPVKVFWRVRYSWYELQKAREQRWRNIGVRSVITRQSHTWFHVRWRQNSKQSPYRTSPCQSEAERAAKVPGHLTFLYSNNAVTERGLIITAAPRNEPPQLFCYLRS